jgi:hypothetical protein
MPDFPSLWIGTSSPSARTLASHTNERWMVNGGAHRDEPPSIKPAAVGEPRQKADWISMQPDIRALADFVPEYRITNEAKPVGPPTFIAPAGFRLGARLLARTSDCLTTFDRSPDCDDDASADEACDQVTNPAAKGHTKKSEKPICERGTEDSENDVHKDAGPTFHEHLGEPARQAANDDCGDPSDLCFRHLRCSFICEIAIEISCLSESETAIALT